MEKNNLDEKPESGEKKDIELSPKIEDFHKKLSKDPNSLIFLPLAEEYRKIGMMEEAIFYLEEGLKKNPSYTLAKTTLARCYFDAKNILKAKDLVTDVLREIPDNAIAMKLKGLILLREGKFDEARIQLQEVLKFRPNDQEVLQFLEQIKAL
jgi:tetratricopeptide (TPR) repeat protein